MRHNISSLPDDLKQFDDLAVEEQGSSSKRNPRNNAATGASAAGARALSAQFVSFYFRAPVKAFFRTRVEYASHSFFGGSFLINVLISLSYMVYQDFLDPCQISTSAN